MMTQLGEMMMTKSKFTAMIKDTVERGNMSYMDAVIHLCEVNKLELEDVKKFISEPIKEKLAAEGIKFPSEGQSATDVKKGAYAPFDLPLARERSFLCRQLSEVTHRVFLIRRGHSVTRWASNRLWCGC